MNCTIWKKVLIAGPDVQEIEVPVGAEYLSAGQKRGAVCVWYRCDPKAEKETRQLVICRTNEPAPEAGRYLGTAFLHGETQTLHVFEIIPPPPA